MAFETKVLDKIHCPRCNGIAEQRIDVKPTEGKFVLVYIVCPVCRLKRYSHTTTRKAVVLHSRIKKLKKLVENGHRNKKKIQGIIDILENDSKRG